MHLNDRITECIDLIISAKVPKRLQSHVHVGGSVFAFSIRLEGELFETFKSFLVVSLIK